METICYRRRASVVPTQGNNVLEGASRRPLQTVTCSRLQVHGTLVLVVVLAVQYARAAEPLPGDLEQLATEKSCYLCHRARPDTNLNLREDRVKGSPEARFRKARARDVRVRGSRVR